VNVKGVMEEKTSSPSAQQDMRRERMHAFQRMADRISFLIVATDYPWIDVQIEIEKMREECERLYPDRISLFEMIYDSRFDRLWEQFRGEHEEYSG